VFGRRRRQDADRSGRGRAAELDEPDFAAADDAGAEPDLGEEPEFDESPEFDDELAAAEDEPAAARAAARRGDDRGDPSTWTRLRDPASSASARAAGPRPGAYGGPWDAAGDVPECERLDFGSLQVPVREGFDIQVNLDEEAGVWVAVVAGDSGLQLQAFAAPKTSGLWEEVRQELVETVAGAGGRAASSDGPFGPEVLALLSEPGEDGTPQPPQPMRFIGADGPRWFLRGLITGPAARDPELARPLEEIFGDVVVVRGEHPEPPRKALDIQLPEEARQAIEEQFADQGMPNPFERGPEITEIR
jgi:hypothetical protein